MIKQKKRTIKTRSKLHEKLIPCQQYRLNPERERKKRYRAKTNNQGQLTRRQNGPDATS